MKVFLALWPSQDCETDYGDCFSSEEDDYRYQLDNNVILPVGTRIDFLHPDTRENIMLEVTELVYDGDGNFLLLEVVALQCMEASPETFHNFITKHWKTGIDAHQVIELDRE